MFAEQIRRAVMAAPRSNLEEISAALWRGLGRNLISDEQAQDLAELIASRRALPVAPKPSRRLCGSRPRSGASLERRRRWAASGWLPPQVASRFTLGECAALSVVAQEHVLRGRCSLPLEHIAALSGTSRSTAKRALAAAKGLGLIQVQERRRTATRSDTNLVQIIASEWVSWLRMRGQRAHPGVGSKPEPPRVQKIKGKGPTKPDRPLAAERPTSSAVASRPDDGGPRVSGKNFQRPCFRSEAGGLKQPQRFGP